MEYWLQQAKMLPAGGHTKIECCASDNSMRIENGTKGYRGWCFRCKETKFEAHGIFSIAELQQRKQELEAWAADKDVKLPSDAQELGSNTEAIIWLLKAGIGQSMWTTYAIYYSSRLNRVILPVFRDRQLNASPMIEGTELQAVVLRSLEKSGPKYLIRERNNDTVFYSNLDTIYPEDRAKDHGYDLVITEDILSAIRVGRIVPSASIVGTSVSSGKITSIMGRVQNYNKINPRIGIWLDPDKAGKKGAYRLAQSLTLLGADVKMIVSERDPKRHSNREIRKYLDGS